MIPGSLGCHGLGKQSVCSSFILFYGSLCKVLRDAFMNGFLLMLLLVRDLRERGSGWLMLLPVRDLREGALI